MSTTSKQVNDQQGHAAGDREAGRALRNGLRSYDVVFRCGGDEFVCGLATVVVRTGGSTVARGS